MDQEKVTCAFCHDRFCQQYNSGRRISFISKIKVEFSEESINNCPKYRDSIDFISGKSSKMPLDLGPTD